MLCRYSLTVSAITTIAARSPPLPPLPTLISHESAPNNMSVQVVLMILDLSEKEGSPITHKPTIFMLGSLYVEFGTSHPKTETLS